MAELRDISLKQIDIDSVADAEENPEACSFEIILNEPASEDWIAEFEYWYKQVPYVVKPPVTVLGDRMHIVYLPRYSDEIQGYMRYLSTIVQHANEEVKRTREILTTDVKERRKADFRKLLQGIELPSVAQPSRDGANANQWDRTQKPVSV